MKVNIGIASHNSDDWDRVLSGDFSRPSATPDWQYVHAALALGDLAEPLGFDGIWVIVPQFGNMPYEEAIPSTQLFAKEVLPYLQKLSAPIHAAVLPAGALA